jgi:CDP-glucose 4,6-dehydratase
LDPLRGYLLAIEHLLKGDTQPAFNFGPEGESLTVEEIVSSMKAEWPNAFKVKLLTEATEKIEATALGLNSDAAKAKLNWTPLFSQEEAVRRTAQWWRRVLDEGMDPTLAVRKDISDHLRRVSPTSTRQ